MEKKNHPIISAAVKSLLITCFGVIGLVLGVFLIMFLFAALPETATQSEIVQMYTPKVLPNHEGIRKIEAKNSPAILCLNIVGFVGLGDLSSDSIYEQLVESREGLLKGDRVKGIILNVNTAGGSTVDMESIFVALNEYRKQYQTPIYAFIDGLCASAGVYIVSVADKIYSSEASLIGSVGTRMPTFMNFSETLDKVGIKSLTIFAGKDKDMMNPLRPWQEGEEKPLREITDYYYARFVDNLTARRPQLNKDKLVSELGASLFPAARAKEYGFIDEMALNGRSVLKEMVDNLGIADGYQVYGFEKKFRLSDLFARLGILEGKMTHRIEFGAGADALALTQPIIRSSSLP